MPKFERQPLHCCICTAEYRGEPRWDRPNLCGSTPCLVKFNELRSAWLSVPSAEAGDA